MSKRVTEEDIKLEIQWLKRYVLYLDERFINQEKKLIDLDKTINEVKIMLEVDNYEK